MDAIKPPATPSYEPLNIEAYEVRLIAFTSSSSTARIECTLEKHSLVFNKPRYVSLSYCWGDESLRKDIVVNGQIVSITASLEEALQAVQTRRRKVSPILVWADALCINQDDRQERSLQVRLMKDIYAKAAGVYACLGNNLVDPVHGGNLPPNLFDGVAVPLPDSELPVATARLLSLLSAPFWQRRWVIQELTTADAIQILYDTSMLTSNDLIRVYQYCLTTSIWLEEHRSAAAPFAGIFQLRHTYNQYKELNLCDTIIKTRTYLSKDPRDCIYAIIGITSDGPTLVPTPNYFQDVGQICAELTRAILIKTGNLEILADVRSREGSTTLPSWALDWCSPHLPVGLISEIADSKHHLRANLISTRRSRGNELLVEGATIGSILSLTSSFQLRGPGYSTARPTSSGTDDNICKSYYGSGELVTSALFRILNDMRLVLPLHGFLFWFLFLRQRPRNSTIDTTPGLFQMWLQHTETDLPGRLQLRKLLTPYRATKRRIIVYTILGVIFFGALPTAIIFSVLPKLQTVSDLRRANVQLSTIIPWIGTMVLVAFWSLHSVLLIPYAKRTLAKNIGSDWRICVLGQGVIGIVCPDARLGDHICRIAGCSQAVVLRQAEGQTSSYSVVGTAKMALNKTDVRRYRALLNYGQEPKKSWKFYSNKCIPRLRREKTFDSQLIESYKKTDWWQKYCLV